MELDTSNLAKTYRWTTVTMPKGQMSIGSWE